MATEGNRLKGSCTTPAEGQGVLTCRYICHFCHGSHAYYFGWVVLTFLFRAMSLLILRFSVKYLAAGAPMPCTVDSCSVEGMIDLLRCQGSWFHAVRLAFLIGAGIDHGSNLVCEVPSQSELKTLAKAIAVSFCRHIFIVYLPLTVVTHVLLSRIQGCFRKRVRKHTGTKKKEQIEEKLARAAESFRCSGGQTHSNPSSKYLVSPGDS